MAKKKVTDEEIPATVEETATEKKTVKVRKLTPKKVKVVAEAPAKPVKKGKNAAEISEEEVTVPKVVEKVDKNSAKKDETIKNTTNNAVTVEKTEDGVVEVKKQETIGEGTEEISIAQKLLSLYNLQQICSKIDEIRMIRGELPEEIRDNEDECEGKRTRIAKFEDEINNLKLKIAAEVTKKKEAEAAIKKYGEQQNNVRNNREYESLSKEIEFQNLETQVSDKHKAKYEAEIEEKEQAIVETKEKLAELEEVLLQKKNELSVIVADTEKEEEELLAKAEILKSKVDQRLLTAFERIRKNAHNGLAIVQIERDACGGCFSMIPPQRQLDIRLHKKIIVCEACGRIFIDHQLVESQNESANE